MEPQQHPHVSHKRGEYPLFGKHDVLRAWQLAERVQEEAYFRPRNQALLTALRPQEAASAPVRRAEASRRCPACGTPLRDTFYQPLPVPACPSCGGLWLDKHTLEHLVGTHEGNWLQRLFEAFLLVDV